MTRAILNIMGSRNGYWPSHPVKELQALLMEYHEAGWRIEKGKKYYKMYCGCPAKHKTTMHLTPSNPNYGKDKQGFLHRQSCYKEEQGEENDATSKAD